MSTYYSFVCEDCKTWSFLGRDTTKAADLEKIHKRHRTKVYDEHSDADIEKYELNPAFSEVEI